MAARSTWSGAISFAGFPIPVKAYNVTKSRASDSFKTLAPNGQPVKQVLVDSNGEPVDRAACGKGVEVAKGVYAALAPEAVEAIQSAERTVTLEPEHFCDLDSVPLHLASGSFRFLPNDKVPGAEKSVQTLWNGLRASGKAMVAEWTPRAGSRDSIIVLYADEEGIAGAQLPYADERNELPKFEPVVDEKAAQMFSQVIEASYEARDFNHEEHASTWKARRNAAVEAAVEGKPVEIPAAPAEAADTPDLLAAMAAALDGESKPKPKAKAKPKAKKEVPA